MKIKYLAHAAFLITSDSGTRIITDPYYVSNNLKHGKIDEAADIVTISHEHGDHSNIAAVKGNPKVITETTRVKDVNIKAITSFHDDKNGKERGKNTIFYFEVDGLRICHCGDLGHLLTDSQVADIGKVDVVLVPVGGYFTIDADKAQKVCDQLKAQLIIPMHFKTDKIAFSIAGIEGFLKGKINVTRSNTSEIELKAGKLPAAQIVVLKPSL